MDSPDGAAATFTYSAGKLDHIAVKGPHGSISAYNTAARLTTFSYGGAGDLTQITYPAGGPLALTYTFDAFFPHKLTQATFGTVVTSFAYSAGAPSATAAGGADFAASQLLPADLEGLTTLAVDTAWATETDPLGHPSRTALDLFGHPTEYDDADGNPTRWQRDADSFVTQTTDALNRVTSYANDWAGSPTLVQYPDGTSASYAYTADAYHHLRVARDQRNDLTSYGYDAADNLLTVTNALLQVTSYTYYGPADQATYPNTLGLVRTETDPLGRVTTYVYDTLGQRHLVETDRV